MGSGVRVALLSELKEKGKMLVVLRGERVALFHVNGKVFAIGDTCTHEAASLSEGSVVNGCVECPHHGARFELSTGKAVALPAYIDAKTYTVTIDGDDIYIA
jgi:nitrite reductase/ring-hydroxylating ferredoxin subunit